MGVKIMKNIVIVGGGFAGLWSALSAARLVKIHHVDNEVQITLINKDQFHGLRPRFYENDLTNTRIPLKEFLDPIKVKLIIGEVTKIDHLTQRIILNQEE